MDSLGSASGSIELDAAQAMAALNQVSAGLRNLDRQSQNQGTGLLSWAGRNEQALKTVGTGLLGVGAAFLGSFGLATKTSMNFDAAISAVGSVAGASSQELSALREEALRLGADTTLGATEAAAAMEIMLKAGASLESVLNGGAEAAINLSEATGVDITLAAETAATAMNIFKTDAKTAADTIAQSANASSLDVNDWALALKAAGPIAKSLGLDMEDLGQAMVILGDAGIKGETGGTALRNILMGLADPAGEAALHLNAMGIATHDAQGNFRGLEEVTHDLASSWGTMDAAQKLQIATMIAGEQGAASFMAIMDAQAESVRNGGDAFQEASTRMDGTGTAAEQAAARMDNLKGSWEQFMGTIETAMITFTSGLAPAMRFVVDAANSLLQGVLALPGPIKTAIGALTGIVGAAGVGAGGFLLLLPRIAETQKALRDLEGVSGILDKLAPPVSRLGTRMSDSITKAGGLRGALMDLVSAHPILAGIAAASALIGVAYATNFMGLRDGVQNLMGVFGKMRDAFRGTSDEAAIAAEDVASFAEATKVVDGKTVYTAFVTNADGTKREVGEIVESVANADGKTAQVLIQGDDGQYWATIDLATGEISNAEIPVTADTRSFTEKVNDALESLKGSMAGSGFAFAIPLVEGLQAIIPVIASVASAIGGFVSSVMTQFEMFSQTRNPLSALVASVAAVLSTIDFGPFQAVMDGVVVALQQGSLVIQEVGNALGSVFSGVAALWQGHWADAKGHFIDALDSILNAKDRLANVANALGSVFANIGELAGTAFDGLAERFPALANTFTSLGETARGFGALLSAVFGTIAAVLRGDWEAAWSGVKRVASSAVNLVVGRVKLLGNIMSDLGNLLQRGVARAVDALSNKFSSFSNTIARVGGVLAGAAGILTGIGDVIAGLMSGDWGRVWGGLGEAFTSAAKGILAAATLIPSLITDVFNAVDWGALWEGCQEAADTAWDAVVDGVSSAWDSITSFLGNVDWGAMWDGMISAARETISSVVDAITNVDWSGFLQGASDILQEGIQLAWNAITSLNWGDWIQPLAWAEWIGGKIADLGTWLWGLISDKFPVANVIAGAIADFAGWLWGKISSLFPSTDQMLIAGNLISDFAVWVWSKIKGLFPSTDQLLIAGGKIGDFAGWVWEKIKAVFPSTSLISAGAIANFANWVWGKIKDIFPSASLITGAISDFGSWLYEKLGSPKLSFPSPQDFIDAFLGWLGPRGEPDDGLDPHPGQPDTPNQQQGFMGGSSGAQGGAGFSLDLKGSGLIDQLNALVAATKAAWATIVADTTTGATGAQAAAVTNITSMSQRVAAGVTTLKDQVGGSFAALSASVLQRSTEANLGANANFTALRGGVAGSVSTLQGAVGASMGALAGNVLTQAVSARSGATSQFSSMAATSGGHFMGMQTAAALQMALMASGATTQGNATMSNMVGALAGGMARVAWTAMGFVTAISSAGGSAADAAYSAGANVSQGFANGMLAYLGVIQGAAAAMVAAAAAAVTAKAMISSPSRLFRGYGAFVGEGFERGIRSSIPDVARASAALVGAGVPSPTVLSTMYGGYGDGGTQYIDRSTHVTNNIALSESDLLRLTQSSDLARAVARHLSDPDASAQFGGA